MGEDGRMQSLEHKLSAIEQIAADLEQGTLPIDEAIDRYARALELVLSCRRSLGELEQRVEQARERTRSGTATQPPGAGPAAAPDP